MRAAKKVLGMIAGASMLAATLGIGSAAFAASPTYYDIYDLTTLAQTAANGLFRLGIMNGTAQGEFSPEGVVTRAQAVKFVVNLVGVPLLYPKEPSYNDVGMGSQYYPYIETALADGYLAGVAGSSGHFDPSAPVTRIQLSVLLINALSDQDLAQSLANNTSLFRLTDVARVPAGELGYANAAIKLGLVPPFYATRAGAVFSPNGQVNREEMAVALWRAYGELKASAPASASLATNPASVGVDQAATLAVRVENKKGQVLTASQLGIYFVSYSLTAGNPSATVSPDGLFVGHAPGTYTVQAAISGGLLTTPVTATRTVVVYGAATAFVVTPRRSTVVADGRATDTVTVSAVDRKGNVVGNFNDKVIVDLSGSGVTAPTTGQPSDVTSAGSAVALTLTNGAGTFNVSGNIAGHSTSFTAFGADATDRNLTAGSGSVTAVSPAAAQVGLSIESGHPASISANVQSHTNVAVVVEDAAGFAWSGAPAVSVKLKLTGPGSFSPRAALTMETLELTGRGTSVRVYSKASRPGTIKISASAAGLAAGALRIPTYINTAPAAIAVKGVAKTDINGNPYWAYTVTLLDSNGHPITSEDGSITVKDDAGRLGGVIVYGAVPTRAFRGTNGPFTTPMTNGVATFAVTTQKIGSGRVRLSIDDTTNKLTATATYRFETGVASTVAVTPQGGPGHILNYEVEGGKTMTISAQLIDDHGNSVPERGQSVRFVMVRNSTRGAAAFPNDQRSFIARTNASGMASVTFNLPQTARGGSFQVSVAYRAHVSMTSDITVVPVTDTAPYAMQVALDGPTSLATAGQAIAGVTANAVNQIGVAVPGDTLIVSSSNVNVVGVRTGSIQSTGAPVVLQLRAKEAGTATITVTDVSNPSLPTANLTIHVSPK
jgi:hypothetical protein